MRLIIKRFESDISSKHVLKNGVTGRELHQRTIGLNYFKFIIMPLLNILILLVVVGVGLWLVNTYIPMDGKIKNILNVVVVIIVVIWLLQVFGILGS